MSQSVLWNGNTYTVPDVGENNWGQNVTDYLVAIAGGALQKTGGTFLLSNEVDFGSAYGIKSLYYKSRSANVGSTGIVRLANADTIVWRNASNTGDLALSINGSNELVFNGSIIESDYLPLAQIYIGDASNRSQPQAVTGDIGITSGGVVSITAGVIVNNDVNASAAIAYSKLNLASSIVNADISTSAAIAWSKMANLIASRLVYVDSNGDISELGWTASGANITSATGGSIGFVTGDGNNTVTVVAPTSSANYTIKWPTAQGAANTSLLNDGSGNLSFALIANANISGSAAIDWSKMANITTGRMLASDGSGDVSATGWSYTATGGGAVKTGNVGEMQFMDSGANTVNLRAPATISSPYTLLLPTATGAANTTIVTDGSGNLSFSLINNVNVGASAAIAYSKLAALTTNRVIVSDTSGFAAVSGWTWNNATQQITSPSSAVFALQDSGTNVVNLQAPTTISSSYYLKFPTAQGASGEVMKNDGSGNLSWYTPTGSGTVNSGLAGYFTYYPSSGTTVDDQTVLTLSSGTIGINSTINTAKLNIEVPNSPSQRYINFVKTGVVTWRVECGSAADIVWNADVAGNWYFSHSGQVYFPDGSTASPSISFRDDVNTGFLRPASDIIEVSLNATRTFLFKGTGHETYVDIVPSAPNTKYLGNSTYYWLQVNSAYYFAGDGTVSLPTHSFMSDVNSGMYLATADDLGFAAGGVRYLGINSTRIYVGSQIRGTDGTAALPAYSFDSDANTGLFKDAADRLQVSCGGAEIYRFGTTQVSSTVNHTVSRNGDASYKAETTNDANAAYISFTNSYPLTHEIGIETKLDSGGGRYAGPANSLNFHAATGTVMSWEIASTQYMALATTSFYVGVPIQGADGSAAAPQYSFNNDTDTGIYRSGANQIAFTVGTNKRFELVDSTGEAYFGAHIDPTVDNTYRIGSVTGNKWYYAAAYYYYTGAGSAANPSYSFNADTDTGLYSAAANSLDVSNSGIRTWSFDGTTSVEGHLVSQTSTCRIHNADGTSALPAYAFVNDTDTGFYRTASGNTRIVGDSNVLVDITTTQVKFSVSANPQTAGNQNLGNATDYWNDVSYKTLTDRGCLPFCDDGVELADGRIVPDTEAIKSIEKHPTKKTVHGLPMLNYKTFPKKAYKKADKEDGTLLPRDANDEPIGGVDGVEMTMMFGVMIGAIKELTQRIEALEKK